MKLTVKRETLTGVKYAFVFNEARSEYIVKNFSDGDIYVAFDEDATLDESIKIPSMIGQFCVTTAEPPDPKIASSDTVYVTGTGEVEVQQL